MRVVLKFGGTSVSDRKSWERIERIVRERLKQGLHPLIVHSALAGVTNRLEQLPEAACRDEHGAIIDWIGERHATLARELEVSGGEAFEAAWEGLRRRVAGVALLGEASHATTASILAAGEQMATALGAAFLASRGIDIQLVDARELLQSVPSENQSERSAMLSAGCDARPDPALQERFDGQKGAILTQGFIARDAEGRTVLLGRGGSDTSAALLAAKLEAWRLEIWTDVAGMFSADPRIVPGARLLRRLDYDEAQEIATMGGRVLHPRCLAPLRSGAIPLHIHDTSHPEMEGTVIGEGGDPTSRVKAICSRNGISLIAMEGSGMWHQVGFLADAFACFKRHGLSVDLVSTSETNVTVSLDPTATAVDASILSALVADLNRICRARVIGPCCSVSLVGRNIRSILHQLGPALALFEEQKIHLLTQASNDLNLTIVTDENQGPRLVQRLHDLLIRDAEQERLEHTAAGVAHRPTPLAWWRARRNELLKIGTQKREAFVYDLEQVGEAAARLRSMRSIDRVFYAMKANPNSEILHAIHEAGLNFECVSRGEVEHLAAAVPGAIPGRVLYTPNFAPREEYEWALDERVQTTLDNLHPLRHWPELFRNRELFVRIDPPRGLGHHDHVRTAGRHSKFGVPPSELDELAELTSRAGARIVGLHAHPGSGVFDVASWRSTAAMLLTVAERFPDVQVLDLGGGLGVPERPGESPLDVDALDEALADVRQAHSRFKLWLEPGRYLVAAAGVLLATVTQLKGKGDVQYIGLSTGMNSLIRPALYGSHHEIVNLTRIDQRATRSYNVVGPICETADLLGRDRLLPPTEEGDILLIANVGAYGRSMSSQYNLRQPAVEVAL